MHPFDMTPRLRIRRRRSSSRHGKAKTPYDVGELASLTTTFLLAVILVTGPLILAAARLWIELPLLAVVALLLLVQGMRLAGQPAIGALRRVDAIDLAAALFVLYAVARWLTSPSEYFSRIEVMAVVACAGLFLTCRYGLANRRHCMALLYALVILGVAETVLGYYLSYYPDWFPFGPQERMQLDYAPRWLGTFEAPTHYACFLVMVIGVALALGSFSKLAWPARIILFYLSVTMIVGVMYSGSLASWLALLATTCALVTMGLRHGTMQWWLPVSGGLVLIAILGFLYSLSPGVREQLSDVRSQGLAARLDVSARYQSVRDAIAIVRDYPVFGSGPGTFLFIHRHYLDASSANRTELTHADFLNCFDDYGLVGFGLALFFVTAVTLKFFRPLWVDNRWQDRVLVAAGFAAWCAVLVCSLVDFNLHIPANAFLFFSLTGLALGRFREDKEAHWSTLSLAPLGRWLGGGVILLSLIYGAQVIRTDLSDQVYEAAFAREDLVPVSQSIEEAGRALSYDRGNAQAMVFLGDMHRLQALLQKNSDDRFSEGQQALDAYQLALQANALDDSLQTRMGQALDLMQKYPEALVHFRQALAAQPFNGLYWDWLGDHYAECGMVDEATQAHQMAEQYSYRSKRGAGVEKPMQTSPILDALPVPMSVAVPAAQPLAPPPQTETPTPSPTP